MSAMDNGQTVSNTVHIAQESLNTPPDLVTLTALANEFWSWIGPSYTAVCTTNCTTNAVIAKQVATVPKVDTPLEAQHVVNIKGTRPPGTQPLPQSLCAVVGFKTPVASRKFRGHNFMPPAIDATAASGDNLTASGAYYTAIQGYVVKLQAGMPPSQTWTGSHLAAWELSIYSRAAQLLGQPSVTGVSGVVIRTRVSWLRSRSHGGS